VTLVVITTPESVVVLVKNGEVCVVSIKYLCFRGGVRRSRFKGKSCTGVKNW